MHLTAVSRFAQDCVRAVIDTVLPDSCPICGADAFPQDDSLSSPAVPDCDCIGRVPRVERFCDRCSAPVGPNLLTDKGCTHCRRDRFAFQSVFAPAVYDGLMRSAVLLAKQARGEPAAGWLADRIWERRGEELASLGIDVVTVIPQHWLRRLTASHNPPELMGRRLASRLNLPFRPQLLVKIRRTPAQASLVPSARRNNLREAFWSAPVKQNWKRVLLVDDVLTTGTTAHRASRALKDAGAETVWVAVAARGIGK